MRAGIVASLCLVIAAIWAAAPAVAATNTKSKTPAAKPSAAVISEPHAVQVGVFTDEAIAKFGAQTQAQRDKLVQETAERIKKMSPKERQAFFEDNRKRYNALPPEKKKELAEKMKKASAEYIAAHKEEWARAEAQEKKNEDETTRKFLEKLPGIERAVLMKYKELRAKGHGRDYAWHLIMQDAKKGVKLTPVPEGK